MQPFVSIIIPIYNNEKYLKQCLDSLINQTLTNIEIICVNDGSTDSSLTIAENYAKTDKRIVVITQKNQGQSVARNRGIEIAQGEYLGFLDSDDWADTQMFEKLYKQAKSLNSDITMCSITTFDETTKEYSTTDPYMTLDLFPKSFENRLFSHTETFNFIFRICVTPWNKIYKTEFIRQNNLKFVEKLNYEDNVFSLETILNTDKISIIKEPLVFYRKNSDTSYSHSTRHDIKKLDFFKIFKLEEKILKEKNLYNSNLKKYFKLYKKNTLVYWLNKIKTQSVKYKYICKFFLNTPSIIFYPIEHIYNQYRFAKLINSQKDKKIVLWGASLFLQDVLKKRILKTDNIVAIVDKDLKQIGKKIANFEIANIETIKNINCDAIVISVIKNPYETFFYVKNYLKENSLQKEILYII